MPNNAAIVLLQQLESVGTLSIRGYDGMGTVREAIQIAAREPGFQFTFEPESDSGLMVYLASSTPQGRESALGGVLIGSLIGLAFDHPGLGATWGTRLGMMSSVNKGSSRSGRGWRIRAVHDERGAPVITISHSHVS